MFHKILVALDRSRNSQEVFNAAIALAHATNATLLLLHVLSYEEEGYPHIPSTTVLEYCPIDSRIFEDYQQQWQTYQQQGLDLLRSYASQAIADGVQAELLQPSGNAGQQICKLAQSWSADLIIIGRRGLSGWQELVLGSVSSYVLHHARCSVLTVQTQADLKAPYSSAEQETTAAS